MRRGTGYSVIIIVLVVVFIQEEAINDICEFESCIHDHTNI